MVYKKQWIIDKRHDNIVTQVNLDLHELIN